MGGTDNALRQVNVDGSFDLSGAVLRLGQDVRQWMGETIGFWHDNALITWTSNIQGWFTHSSWEYSNNMQIIEIWSERQNSAGNFLGL